MAKKKTLKRKKGGPNNAKKTAKRKVAKKKTPKKKSAKLQASRANAHAAATITPKRKPSGPRADDPVVVYIHGIGPKPSPEILKGEWDLALFGRDMRDRTRMAYWADILHKPIESRKASVHAEAGHAFDLPQVLQGTDAETDPAAHRFAEDLLQNLGGPTPVRPKGPGKKVLPLPEFLRGPISGALMRWFVRDTAAYFFDADVRKKIKQRLLDQIPATGEPYILVSHSQGTIVAFEVLSQLQPSNAPLTDLFVTLGSPLGLQEVQDQFKKSKLALEVPQGVRQWHNFANLLDPVALDRSLSDDYRRREQVAVKDHPIISQRLRELRGFNPHASAGYLAHPEVRAVVHRALQFDSVAPFIVARDVAERFVSREARQPVLLEVLEPRYAALGESDNERDEREAQQELQDSSLKTIPGRVSVLAREIIELIKEAEPDDGSPAHPVRKVNELRKYVAAHLNSGEIETLAKQHADLNIYRVWRSSPKRKLLHRSHNPLSVGAARTAYAADGHGITWAVLDTGCHFGHPHFKVAGMPRTVREVLDCTTNDTTPVEITKPNQGDPDGHGTHVCGIIAGQGSQNGFEYAGLAPRAELIVYKVLDENGEGEDAWIIKAVDDIFRRNQAAAAIKIHGVNLSLGGAFDASVFGCGFTPICTELRELWRQGVVVCIAAGNEGLTEVSTATGSVELNTALSIGDPANLEECIAVGSTNADKPHLHGVSYFSSRGPTADGRMKPDVVAPGEKIVSCNSKFKSRGNTPCDYREDSGTSMACPHISGLIAAFLSVKTEFIGRPDEVKQILMANCNDLKRDRYHQGAGMPNLMKMLMNS
jgi:hypothetical protein